MEMYTQLADWIPENIRATWRRAGSAKKGALTRPFATSSRTAQLFQEEAADRMPITV